MSLYFKGVKVTKTKGFQGLTANGKENIEDGSLKKAGLFSVTWGV